jgi:hypothetical protein
VGRAGTDRGNSHDQRLEGVGVVGVGRGHGYRQRQAGPVGQYVDLRSGLASIDRAGAGHGSPLLALTEAPSRTARDQSIRPRLPQFVQDRAMQSSP